MDVLVALAVVVVLFGAIIGLVRWARGGAPYDDGTAGMYVPYVPEPGDEPGGEPEPRDAPEPAEEPSPEAEAPAHTTGATDRRA